MADLSEQTIADFLGHLGAKAPTPGGGATSALVCAIGAALGQMAVNYSIGRKSLAEHEPALQKALRRLSGMQGEAIAIADDDERAYLALNELWKLPQGDARRTAEMPGAVQAAMIPPRRSIELAIELLELLETLTPITNRNLRSDLAIAAVLARAAADASRWNIAINAPMLDDDDERIVLLARAKGHCAHAAQLCARIEEACA
jgi:formiminotetrahydrofolate cyclodeaminase